MAESEELKSLLMKVKEKSKKIDLKFNIQKTKITASGPITSWQIDRETMETVRDFTFGGSKYAADDHWSQEIKRHLLLGKKAVRNLHSILNSRDIANKGLSGQSYGFFSVHVWIVRVGQKRKLSTKDLMLLNCGVGKDSRVPWTT